MRSSHLTRILHGNLAPADRVLGLACNGVAKAYPVKILNWHEIVNDRFGEEPIFVTYCPLCGTGIAYLASRDARSLPPPNENLRKASVATSVVSSARSSGIRSASMGRC